MTQLKEKENEVAVKTVKREAPPEGFISFDDFVEQNPKFCEKYEGNREAHMAIWLDEPAPLKFRVSRHYDTTESVRIEDPNTGKVSYENQIVQRSRVEDVVINSRKSETIKVWEFITWFGDPKLKLHLAIFPTDVGYDNKFWTKMRKEKLRIFGRELVMKPVGNVGSFTTPASEVSNVNDEHDLWDKYPKFFVLLPDKMVMSTGGEDKRIDPIDYVWEVMSTRGISLTRKSFDEDDIKGVMSDLQKRAKELNIEGVFGSDATGTIIEGFMIRVREKYGK